MKYDIGIVIPVYNATETVKELLRLLMELLAGYRWQVCLVDDHSDEEVFRYLSNQCLREEVSLIRLSQNCGQQNAVLCGIRRLADSCATLVTMDDDLQNPPQLLRPLINKIEEGYDLVYAVADEKAQPFYRKLGSHLRNLFFTLVFHLPAGTRVSSYRIMTHQLAKKIAAWDGNFFYFSAAALRLNPKIANLRYPAEEKSFGNSGYSLRKLITLYLNLVWNYGPLAKQKRGKKSGCPYTVQSIIEGVP